MAAPCETQENSLVGCQANESASETGRSGIVVAVVVALAFGNAKIVVSAKVDIVVRRIIVVVDILDILQLIIVISEIAVGFAFFLLLFGIVEWNRLFRLEHRLGIPFMSALDAGYRFIIAEIVEAGSAIGAGTLGTPFSLRHSYYSLVMLALGAGLLNSFFWDRSLPESRALI